MSLLPFARLPLLAQLEIIRCAEFPDLFRLSTCSKKMARIIRLANISFQKFGIMMYRDHVLFNFQFPNTECEYKIAVDWDFREWMNENRLFMRESMDSSGNQWKLDIRVRENEFHSVAREVLSFLLQLFKRTELRYLVGEPSDITKNMVKNIVKPHFSTVQQLICAQYEDSKPLTRAQFEWVLDCMTVTEQFTSQCQVNTEVPYCKGFQADIVMITHPEWVNLNSILSSSTKYFHFENDIPTFQSLNLILKAWISNEKLTNLKDFYAEIGNESSIPICYKNHVMEGIQEAILTPEEQNHFDEQDIKNAVKFIRRVDGRLGFLEVSRFTVSFFVE